MNCPSCSVGLRKKALSNIEVDECEKCKGIWFEDDELRKAKDSSDPDLNWMDFDIGKNKDQVKARPGKLRCPQCNKSLVVINYGNTGVEIDYCPSCKGTWLNKGEFKKIVDGLTNELLTKPFSKYIKASIEEAKEIVTGSEGFVSEWKDFATVLQMMQHRLFIENPKLLDAVITIQKVNPIK